MKLISSEKRIELSEKANCHNKENNFKLIKDVNLTNAINQNADTASFDSDSEAWNTDKEKLSCNSSDTTRYDAEHIFDTNIDE